MANKPLTAEESAGQNGDDPVIAEALTKRFGEFIAVDRVSFHIHAGRFSAGWGQTAPGKPPPSGCCWG